MIIACLHTFNFLKLHIIQFVKRTLFSIKFSSSGAIKIDLQVSNTNSAQTILNCKWSVNSFECWLLESLDCIYTLFNPHDVFPRFGMFLLGDVDIMNLSSSYSFNSVLFEKLSVVSSWVNKKQLDKVWSCQSLYEKLSYNFSVIRVKSEVLNSCVKVVTYISDFKLVMQKVLYIYPVAA